MRHPTDFVRFRLIPVQITNIILLGNDKKGPFYLRYNKMIFYHLFSTFRPIAQLSKRATTNPKSNEAIQPRDHTITNRTSWKSSSPGTRVLTA